MNPNMSKDLHVKHVQAASSHAHTVARLAGTAQAHTSGVRLRALMSWNRHLRHSSSSMGLQLCV